MLQISLIGQQPHCARRNQGAMLIFMNANASQIPQSSLPSHTLRVFRSCGLWPSCFKAVLWCVWSQTALWGMPTERGVDSLAHRQERDKAI